GAAAEPAPLRGPGRAGPVLPPAAPAPGGAEGVPQRPAHQPPPRGRRRHGPRPGERAGGGEVEKLSVVSCQRKTGRRDIVHASRSPKRERGAGPFSGN